MSDSHMLKSIALADQIVASAEHGLSAFERSINHFPAQFRAIMWDAVVEIAGRRAEAARQSHKGE